ncbi:hypothetical protein T439DRAFT_322291 [Meredithblackwellia eburnea MCA 4105]
MHGYIDSILIPLHLPNSLSSNQASTSKKGSGKQKEDTNTPPVGAGGTPYDVVANWTPEERDQVQRNVLMASRLGYSTILLTLPIPPSYNPSLLVFPTPLFPEMDPRTADKGKEGSVLQWWRLQLEGFGDEELKKSQGGAKGVYGFSNSTVPLLPPSLTILSLPALTPTTLSYISLTLSPPSAFSPSLLSVDPSLSPRLPFVLKRGLVHTLLRSGVKVELVMRGLVEQGEAGTRRRNWFNGAKEVVRAFGGENVVLSSLARREAEMRAPEDWVNLCQLVGMKPEQAKNAVTANPRAAILRGRSSHFLSSFSGFRFTRNFYIHIPSLPPSFSLLSNRFLKQRYEHSIQRNRSSLQSHSAKPTAL